MHLLSLMAFKLLIVSVIPIFMIYGYIDKFISALLTWFGKFVAWFLSFYKLEYVVDFKMINKIVFWLQGVANGIVT